MKSKKKTVLIELVIAACVVLGTFGYMQSDAWTKVRLIQMGNKEMEKGNYIEAREYFDECLEQFPDYGKAYIGIGDIYAMSNQKSNAIFWYYHAVSDDKYREEAIIKVANAQLLPEKAYRGLEDDEIFYYWIIKGEISEDEIDEEFADVVLECVIERKEIDAVEQQVAAYNQAIKVLKCAYEQSSSKKVADRIDELEVERTQKIELLSSCVVQLQEEEYRLNRSFYESGNVATYKDNFDDGDNSYSYNEYGDLLYVNGWISHHEYEYDECGNILVRKIVCLENNSTLGRTEYRYENGCLVSEEEYDEQGDILSKEEYVYDEEGSLVESYVVYMTEAGERRVLTHRYIYDQYERIVEEQVYSNNFLSYIYEYNEEGNLIEARSVYPWNVTFEYSDTGELRKITAASDESGENEEYYICKEGNQRILYKEGRANLSEVLSGVKKNIAVFTYDENGNCVTYEHYNNEQKMIYLYTFEYSDSGSVKNVSFYKAEEANKLLSGRAAKPFFTFEMEYENLGNPNSKSTEEVDFL